MRREIRMMASWASEEETFQEEKAFQEEVVPLLEDGRRVPLFPASSSKQGHLD
jgi:hypothetical protein